LANRTTHPLEQSCLFGLTSVHKLAELLFSSIDGLNALAITENRYRCWDEPKKNGGFRRIEAPYENLKKVQRRISDLLLRVQPPDYLMAPVKRRSYVDNAAKHRESKAFCLLDIEDFFPSCTDKKAYWFFNKRMHCAPHVASLLTKLVSYQGHLPQGSPASPIMAYLAYSDMWNEIDTLIKNAKCVLTIYADDITISGNTVPGEVVWQVKQTLHRHGHRYSRKKERHLIDKPADITGVIVSENALLLPNRQHEKIAKLTRQRNACLGESEVQSLDRKLRGRFAQARQIETHNL
jgi:retron-type reverse transcriptase